MSDGEMWSYCATFSMANWSDEDHFACDNKTIHYRCILFRHTHDLVKILCAILIGSTVKERSFSCIWQINDRLSISVLRDQLGDFAITAVHSHTILILKTDICHAYISITLVGWRCLTFYWQLSSWIFVCFHSLRLWKWYIHKIQIRPVVALVVELFVPLYCRYCETMYMQFNLLVTILHCMII